MNKSNAVLACALAAVTELAVTTVTAFSKIYEVSLYTDTGMSCINHIYGLSCLAK